MKRFRATHLYFKSTEEFSEETAPDWLTSKNTKLGSTTDNRWFWTDHVLKLPVGGKVDTDFHTIERLE